jgi:hypothetical protein
LVAWRRIEGADNVSYPLGPDAIGMLIYTSEATMAVQITAANRPQISTSDSLGGDVNQRAGAYSMCLAYFGAYEVQGETFVHNIESSLFPNWSGTVQSRPLSYDGKELVLSTPPVEGPGGTVVNELSWMRVKYDEPKQ